MLKKLGGQYLCDQRIYPPSGPHLSAWEWAFDREPSDLADALAKELTGAARSERTFRYADGSGKVIAVVDVRARSEGSTLACKDIPASAKALVVVSER